jgi:hypothetical protein
MIRFLLLFLTLSTINPGALCALNVKNNALKNPNLFSIEFPAQTRRFMAREQSVTNISLHDYITPPYKVVELTINSHGQSLLRIYHSQLLSPTELAETLGSSNSTYDQANKFRQPIGHAMKKMEQKMTSIVETPTITTVIKEYPIATHAKNIEYRLSRLSELVDLHESLIKHWGGEKINDSDSLSIDKETDNITPDNSKKSSGKLRLGGSIFTIEH